MKTELDLNCPPFPSIPPTTPITQIIPHLIMRFSFTQHTHYLCVDISKAKKVGNPYLTLIRYWARLMLAADPVMVTCLSVDPSTGFAILICAPDIWRISLILAPWRPIMQPINFREKNKNACEINNSMARSKNSIPPLPAFYSLGRWPRQWKLLSASYTLYSYTPDLSCRLLSLLTILLSDH